MATLFPRYLSVPLRHHEATYLHRHPDILRGAMGITYSGDPATAHSRLFLTVGSEDAMALAHSLKVAANQHQDEPGDAETGLQAPYQILSHLRHRVEAEYVGYRASQVMDDLIRGGEWLHNERLTPFDGKTAYQLITEDGRTNDVLRYLASLGAGVAG